MHSGQILLWKKLGTLSEKDRFWPLATQHFTSTLIHFWQTAFGMCPSWLLLWWRGQILSGTLTPGTEPSSDPESSMTELKDLYIAFCTLQNIVLCDQQWVRKKPWALCPLAWNWQYKRISLFERSLWSLGVQNCLIVWTEIWSQESSHVKACVTTKLLSLLALISNNLQELVTVKAVVSLVFCISKVVSSLFHYPELLLWIWSWGLSSCWKWVQQV